METSNILRQLLRSPAYSVHALNGTTRARPRTLSLLYGAATRNISNESLPRVAQPSMWTSLIPNFLRRSHDPSAPAKPKSKEWNPATPYIILALLIGSQAIQTLSLKKDMAAFNRKAEAKMGLLREVIERVQKGEEVDVERVLGTGDEGKEAEWKEVLKEIEDEKILFESKKRRRAARRAAAEEDEGQQPQPQQEPTTQQSLPDAEAQVKVEKVGKASFH